LTDRAGRGTKERRDWSSDLHVLLLLLLWAHCEPLRQWFSFRHAGDQRDVI